MVYWKLMASKQKQEGIAALVAVAIIAVVGIGFILISSIVSKSNSGNPLKVSNKPTSSGDNNIALQTACKNAIGDYPEWTKADTDLIIWENPDKSINFRNSPEDASTKITSPIPSGENLVDMDFLGLNEISYLISSSAGWKIGILKLNGLNPLDNSIIYEKSEAASYINASPVSKNDFVIIEANGNKGALKRIDTNKSTETIVSEISPISTDNLKISVSPKGTYFYLLQGGNVVLFDLSSNKQLEKIDSVNSASWVGDSHLLYSGSDGTFLYNAKSKEKSKVEKMGSVLNLTFNPKDGGVIAYDEKGNTNIIGCNKWNIINSKQGAEFKTLTSEKTAITKKGEEFGYWRFKDRDWGVKILENKSKYVTVWQRY